MRYYLNFVTGADVLADAEGAEFDELESAIREAAQSGRDLIANELRNGRAAPVDWEAQVCLADDSIVHRIPFSDLMYGENAGASRAEIVRDPRGSNPNRYIKVVAAADKARAVSSQIATALDDMRKAIDKLPTSRR